MAIVYYYEIPIHYDVSRDTPTINKDFFSQDELSRTQTESAFIGWKVGYNPQNGNGVWLFQEVTENGEEVTDYLPEDAIEIAIDESADITSYGYIRTTFPNLQMKEVLAEFDNATTATKQDITLLRD